RTAAGREKSKCNAADHCLSGEGLVLPEEEAAAVNDRFAQWQSSLRPFDTYDLWLYELLVIESVRIDTAQRKLTALQHEQAHRAQHSWDDDQQGEAERIAERLARSPGRVVAELRGFKQGALWLIRRWQGLVDPLRRNGRWTEAQRAVVLDLLAVPADLRDEPGPLEPAAGQSEQEACLAVAEWEIEQLQKLVAE